MHTEFHNFITCKSFLICQNTYKRQVLGKKREECTLCAPWICLCLAYNSLGSRSSGYFAIVLDQCDFILKLFAQILVDYQVYCTLGSDHHLLNRGGGGHLVGRGPQFSFATENRALNSHSDKERGRALNSQTEKVIILHSFDSN